MSDNPFADPFADDSVTAAQSAGVGVRSSASSSSSASAYGNSYSNPFEHATPVSTSAYGVAAEPKKGNSRPLLASAASPKRSVELELKPQAGARTSFLTEEELAIREQNLLRREAELAEREREVDSRIRDGKPLKSDNWPFKCYPLAYHSIPTEIPEPLRPLVRQFYVAVLFTWLCIFWNWFTYVIGWLIQDSNLNDITASDALWSSIYLVIGVPGSWKGWYRSVYYAVRDRATGKWLVFFVTFMIHIVFTVLMGLGVPNCAGAGFFVMTKLFLHHQSLTGIFALCNLSVWGLNGLVSLYLLKRAHHIWKNGGGLQDLKKKAAQAAVAEAVNQQLASDAPSSDTDVL